MNGPVEVWTCEASDAHAGTLYHHRRRGAQSATFTYAPGYLASRDAYAIDPQLTLSAVPHHSAVGRALFGIMADGAPDRWGRTLLLRREAQLAKLEGRSVRSLGEVDFLLGVRDDVRQGALRYADSTGTFLAADDQGVPALTDLPALLALAGEAERDAATLPDLQRLIHAGGSLGGARPKAHVQLPDGTLAIAKFPSADKDTWDVMAWESVALTLAERAGIQVPEHRLLDLAGRRVLLVTRFDRSGGALTGTRIGYASAMTMLEAAEGEDVTYVDLAAAIVERSIAVTADLEQLWRRMVFNIAIGNTDDHARNHGFLHVAGADAWRLSPAFDINPTPTPAPRRHATSIDATGRASTLEGALEVAGDFRLSHKAAGEIMAEVLSAVAGWSQAAVNVGLDSRAIKTMEVAFESAAS